VREIEIWGGGASVEDDDTGVFGGAERMGMGWVVGHGGVSFFI
jgi:hypothetical protein